MSESEIDGKGFGDKHKWKNVLTKPCGCNSGAGGCDNPNNKYTLWVCKICSERFLHYYDVTPNIFKAMKAAGVPEDCNQTS